MLEPEFNLVYFLGCANIPSVNQINDPKYKAVTDRIFWESFFGIFIFGVPAFVAVNVGEMLDNQYGTGRLWVYVCLAVAFVTSWITVFFRNRRVIRMYREMREEQRKAKG
jgi:hypothetical protein